MQTATFAHEVSRHNWQNFAIPGAFVRGVWEKFDKNYFKTLENVSPAGAICASAVDMKQYLDLLVRKNLTQFPGAPPVKAKNDVLNSASNVVPAIPGFTILGK